MDRNLDVLRLNSQFNFLLLSLSYSAFTLNPNVSPPTASDLTQQLHDEYGKTAVEDHFVRLW
jgi:hypothetical protein